MRLVFRLHNRLAARSVVAAAALLLVTASASSAATLRFQDTLMTGLSNPRGMTIGPDGALYVAEAGNGSGGDASAPSIVSGDGSTVHLGMSGGISSWLNGAQERVISGLASLAAPGGSGATGVHDIAFSIAGTLHAIIGFGADPTERNSLPTDASLMGQIVSFPGGIATALADLAEYERTANPDGAGLDSNPFSLVALPGGGFVASDSGGNSILSVDEAGVISTLAVLQAMPNPTPIGGPTYQAVPTGIALGPDDDILIGQLTGFPFPVGAANIYSLDGHDLSIFATGFTNLIDVAYGENSMIYALEHDIDGILGSLFGIDKDGSKTLLYGGLESPTGLALGLNGQIYVAVNGLSGSDGRVIALAPVPLPAALPVMALLLASLYGVSLIGRRRT